MDVWKNGMWVHSYHAGLRFMLYFPNYSVTVYGGCDRTKKFIHHVYIHEREMRSIKFEELDRLLSSVFM